MKSSKLLFQVALAFTGTMAISAWLQAQAVSPSPAAAPSGGIGPKIQFDTENYNFGQIMPGEPLKYTFTVTNAGDEPLIITNAAAGCSCTVIGAKFPLTLAPHETSKIPLQITTTSFSKGPYTKPVTVTSNDKDKSRQTVVLQMHLTAWFPIDVNPQPRAWLTVMPDAETTPPVTLHIINNTAEPLTLSKPVSSTTSFSTELLTNIPGKEYDLVITPAPVSKLRTTPSISVVQGNITMKTSVSNMPELTIPVVASIMARVVVQPSLILLPPGPLTRAQTNTVTIHANITNGITVSDPTVNIPGVTVDLQTLISNRTYLLHVGFPVGFHLIPGQNVSVSVKSDVPGFSPITLSVQHMPGLPASLTGAPRQQTPGGRVIPPSPAAPAVVHP